MFLGEYEHSLDEKNRVVLPSNHRKEISEEKLAKGFVLARGSMSQCLDLHPKGEWLRLVRHLEGLYPYEDEEAQEYLRDLFSSAEEVQLDKQFRFVIPDARRLEVGIEKDVFFVGNSRKIEIWPKERWEARRGERRGKFRPPGPVGSRRAPFSGAAAPPPESRH
jgi:MraZ protein